MSLLPAYAQRGEPEPLLPYLNTLNYDPAQYAPLIVVDPGQVFTANPPLPEGHAVGLATLAEAAHLRVVSAGRINALVPPTRLRLTTKPDRANPFGGMKRDELVKLLVNSLTAAQWQIIGRPDGIGAGDLTEAQRLLWADILPSQIGVQKSTVEPGDEPHSIKYTDTSDSTITDVSSIRLRISKKVTWSFSKKGSDEMSYGGDPYQESLSAPGQIKYMLRLNNVPDKVDAKRNAYGAALVTEDANTEKAGAVDYDAESLDPRVSLRFAPKPATSKKKTQQAPDDGGESLLPTIGDLVGRINTATRLHFVADRRVRDLPVFLRGDSARSGDLLRALARSVCGTFRKLPPASPGEDTLYLLTSDREGTGTTAARLGEWAETAVSAKFKIMDGAAEKTAKLNPLGALRFAPDDPYALSKAQNDADEEAWRKEQYGTEPDVKWEDLSPALQKAVQAYQQSVLDDGENIRIDRLRLGEELTTYLILPGIGAVEADDTLNYSVKGQYLQRIAYDPALAHAVAKTAAKPNAHPVPFAWPAKLTRRLLVASPKTAEDAVALARSAHARGFTELWLQIGLADPAASAALLDAGVKAGTALHLAVGGMVPLLRDGGLPGEPDRTILGETGAEFGARKLLEDKETGSDDIQRYSGWVEPPSADALAARLAPLAAVPHLASLALRNTVAPGWSGARSGGDDLWTHFGYTLRTRRAFLAEYGIDPVDLVEENYSLRDIDWNLGYFTQTDNEGDYKIVGHEMVLRPASEVPHIAWDAFRDASARTLLSNTYVALRKAHPALPLFLDDRLTPYAMQRPDNSWFGSWDAAGRLPDNPPFSQYSEIHTAARSASKTIFADWGDAWNWRVGTPQDTPAYFTRIVGIVAKANLPPSWDGVAIDVPFLPAADVLRLLTGLPPVN